MPESPAIVPLPDGNLGSLPPAQVPEQLLNKTREIADPIRAAIATHTRTIGIIRPPHHIRIIADKLAQFVAKTGPEFERKVIQSHAGDPKFNFLNPASPYHAYYRHKLSAPKPTRAAPSVPSVPDKAEQLFRHVPKLPAPENDGLEPPMRIVKDWKRPDERITAGADRDPRKPVFTISPITGELIPDSEMSEHMRISLIDPKYKEQKRRMLAKIRETALAQDDEISRNIAALARTRPDIFGTTEEEVSSATKAEVKEKIDEQPKQVTWDIGHTGSITRAATNQALDSDPPSVPPIAFEYYGPTSSGLSGPSIPVQLRPHPPPMPMTYSWQPFQQVPPPQCANHAGMPMMLPPPPPLEEPEP